MTAVLTGPCDTGNEDTIFTDAFNRLLHHVIVSYAEWVIWKWMKLI